MTKPRIGLVLGDPCGIGPEIVARLLDRPEVAARADLLVFGDRAVFAAGQKTAGLSLEVPEVAPEAAAREAGGIALRHVPFAAREACPPGTVCAQAGAHAHELLRMAADAASRRELDPVGFAPLNKQAMM
ncbi:MAG: 4-hydroxythreonine-4-phosphate dehydrogenase PdxA, partial [Proteobacteria bacterium]|nr:4-hydroxythreonine-4-phosphate dehydrogenase PdxA [Pseudomonadota bacterium]